MFWNRLRTLAAIALTAFAVAGIAGPLSLQSAMPGGAPLCGAMGHIGAMCPMNAAQHLASWQDAFRSLPPKAFGREAAFALHAARPAFIEDGSGWRSGTGAQRAWNHPPPRLIAVLISEGILQRTVYR